MHRFWLRFIVPLLLAAGPKRVLEIGAEFGWNTRGLLELGRQHGFFLDIVDPAPHPAFHEELARFDGGYEFHQAKSLNIIAALPAPDFVLLDGDHNWFTVFNELQQIFFRAHVANVAPPIVLMHDCAWPYARRDMYYDVTDVHDGDRQPYARRGFIPGRSELTDEGINGHFANAVHEGGPRNGVLTAVEDFLASASQDIEFHRLPFFNGLGIVIPRARASDAVQKVVASFFTPESLLETCETLELDAMNVRVELHQCQLHLTRRTDALMRARTLIAELQQQLADAGQAKEAVLF
jgi:hypothetical protein